MTSDRSSGPSKPAQFRLTTSRSAGIVSGHSSNGCRDDGLPDQPRCASDGEFPCLDAHAPRCRKGARRGHPNEAVPQSGNGPRLGKWMHSSSHCARAATPIRPSLEGWSSVERPTPTEVSFAPSVPTRVQSVSVWSRARRLASIYWSSESGIETPPTPTRSPVDCWEWTTSERPYGGDIRCRDHFLRPLRRAGDGEHRTLPPDIGSRDGPERSFVLGHGNPARRRALRHSRAHGA